jgi:hypothetical protein
MANERNPRREFVRALLWIGAAASDIADLSARSAVYVD